MDVDLLAPNPTINMAEGNYDIIGAKELYFPDESNNNIFVAIGTRTAYKRVLGQILKMTGWLNANVNIFADNDKDTNLDWYKEMFKEWRPLFDRINKNRKLTPRRAYSISSSTSRVSTRETPALEMRVSAALGNYSILFSVPPAQSRSA